MDNLPEVLKDLDKFVATLTTKLTLDIVETLTQTNPVDTGWSRSNWIPTIGKAKHVAFGSKKAVSSSAQQEGLANLLHYTLKEGNIFVKNNVPYVGILNERHATAQGFVQRAIINAIRRLGP